MGQHGIARAEDAVVAEVDIDLLLEGLLQIDLGDDPEAFLLEAFNTATNSLFKADRQCLAEIIAHRELPFGIMPTNLESRALKIAANATP
jgi:hypothetical protein